MTSSHMLLIFIQFSLFYFFFSVAADMVKKMNI